MRDETLGPPDAARPTILVVEDEAMLLDVVAAELADAGFRVLCAASAEEADGMLGAGAGIDLLFTDIRLPGRLDGWDLAERARALNPALPVIYVTGYSAEAPRQVSASVLVMKPYRPSAIVRVARQLGIG
ncbi:MAG TPA: response regulator [Methylobacterium sp.]|nr:response regulator [Methylobacterium sp.]